MAENVFVFPASSAQERLWVLHQLDPSSSAYNLPGALRLRGALDVTQVIRALDAIVARHEVLRTTFDVVDGVPSQIVAEEGAAALERIDLSALSEPQREHELARLLRQRAGEPFDLERGPLLRLSLVRLGAHEHVLSWVVHHIVFDGQSTGLLLGEFAALYARRSVPEPALQYADFADWQRRLGARFEEQLGYWRSALEGDDELALPPDFPRAAVRGQRGARLFFALPDTLVAALRALAQRERVSLFSVLVSGYAVLLARLGRVRDVRIGTPVTNRSRPELQPVIGNFANTVVLRANLADDPSFTTLVARVQQAVQAAQEHGDVPFDRVVEALNPARDLGRGPLCQVFFALQPGSVDVPAVGGLETALLDIDPGASQFDLALELAASGDALAGALEYDTDLFTHESAQRIAAQYVRLLQSAVAGPRVEASRLAVASAEEQLQVLALGRQRAAGGSALLARIEAQAARAPEAVAIEEAGRTLCYGALRARVSELAAALRARGIGPERTVGIVMPRSSDAIVAMLATLEAGGAYVPVDPTYPPERIAQLLTGVDLTLRGLEALAPARDAAVACVHPDQLAYVIHTSGSTGVPKRVGVPRRALDAFVESALALYALRPGDRVLQFASLSFDASVEEIFPSLAAGATLVLRDEEMVAAPARFFGAAEALGITVLDLPTSFFHRAVAEAPPQPVSSLRLLILGGEAALRERVQAFFAATAVRVVNSYGPTEATVVATACDVDGAGRGAVPIGGPLPHVQALVLDARLTPCPIGVVGDLYLGGEGLARGYLGDPAQSAAAWLPNPHASTPGGRMYATGDRARFRADGALEFAGRADHQVKLRGYRVELGEVAARVAEVAGVREVLADVRDGQLIAYVAADLDGDVVRTALRARLPDFMVPAQIVVRAALPKTPQGKIDRRALSREPLAEERVRRAPESTRERALCAVWQEVLQRASVGVDDNFFALGGDSILALSVVARARAAGIALTPRQVFQHQTVAELARAVEAPSRAASAPVRGHVPLTPIQRWFFEHAGPNPHHWNQAVWVAPREAIDVARLERALHEAATRHDALCLRFERDPDQGWQQRAEGQPRVAFVRIARGEPRAELARLQRSLHLADGPVLVAAWFEQVDAPRLLLVAHHLVIDGVSLRVLVEDVEAVYRGRAMLAPSGSFTAHAASAPAPFLRDARVPLRVDDPGADAREAGTRQLAVTLDAPQTAALVARGDVECSLIVALAEGLAARCDGTLSLEIEGHGRDVEAIDVTRTVGWFTSLRTVSIDLGASSLQQEVARALRAAVPRYGRADVAFNYLGQIGAEHGLFRVIDDDVGEERDPEALRTHALEVDAVILDGVLRIRFSHGASLEGPSVAAIAEHVRARLGAEAAGDDEGYPLSPLQQGLLFHSLYEPGHDAYVEQVTCTLEGALDLGAFRRAWADVLARHDVLRNVFVTGAEAPRQRAVLDMPLALAIEPLGERSLEEVVSADRARGFDLACGPLMRVTLLEQEPGRWSLLWTHHHLILDGWSAALVLRDVFASYEGATLPPCRARYRDYIAWLGARPQAASSAFWRARLAGFSAATELPFDAPRNLPRTAHEVATRALPEHVTARLEAFARRHHVTLNTLVQAAWALVLSRVARRADVLFGITTSGRSADLPELDQVAGLFINTLPLRLDVAADRSSHDFLREVAQHTAACVSHEHTPLSEARGYSAVPAGQPLFESLLVFESYPSDARLERGVAGLRVRDVAFVEETNYPLTITVAPGARLALRVGLDPRRFAGAGEALLDLLEHALGALADDRARPLGTLALSADVAARVARWNATEVTYEPSLVHTRIAARAAAHPEHTAVVFAGRRTSYRELDARANQLAHALLRMGVGPDTLVAVAAERSLELVIALLGVLKAGAAYVPIDPDYPPDRIAYMLEDAGAPVLLSQWPVAARLGLTNGTAQLLCLDADRAQIEREPSTAPDVRVHPQQLAYTLYTSGSTGRPKGAGNTHRALFNRLAWMQEHFGLTADDRVLQKTPFSFDVSVWEFFWPLMEGATLVVAAPGAHRDPDRLQALIHAERVTTLHFVPPMLEAFLEVATPASCSSLRRIVCSGEALPGELARRCLAQLPVALHNLYGPTEAAIDVSAWACERDGDDGTMPIGRPIANLTLYVLDAVGQLVPPGVAGELHIGGVGLARGYHLRPELTAERFVPDPFATVPGARLYRTGDLVRQRADGVLEFLGRLDHQVKIRGLRVELGEVEAELLRVRGVREAVVVARAQTHGGKQLVGYVSGDALEPEALRAALSARLPAYMIPAQLVALPRLPLSPNGKVDRRALPAPDAGEPRAYVAPRTHAEQILAEVWQDVLRVERVGVDDDFFALGGDSIVSLQVIARAAQRGLTLSPKDLFEHPTVAGAAACAHASELGEGVRDEARAPEADLSADEWSDLLDELER